MKAIDGYKTYIIAAVAIGYAFFGLLYGAHDANAAMQIVLAALGGAALRNGISKG